MNIEALVGTTLGTCTLQKVIGHGVMSVVFLAQQSRPNRQVAVKVLLVALSVAPGQRATFLEHFPQEIDVAASLQHPNIIQIHEYGEHHGLAYLVMPYINGGTLYDEMQRVGPFSLEKAVSYLEQVAAALDYAHTRGVIHYSIKPTNILLRRDGRLLLTDFGQVKSISREDNLRSSDFTRTATSIGDLDYIAPEQAVSSDVDTRADLYSLGAILYQMITGKVPFAGGAATHHQFTHPQPPCMLRPDLPASAEQVMLKALEIHPKDRYTNVQDFASAFRQALTVADIPPADFSNTFTDTESSSAQLPTPLTSFDALHQQPHQITNNQDKNIPIEMSPAITIVNKNTHRNDIVARTRLTLPSMTDFLPHSLTPQSAALEIPSTTTTMAYAPLHSPTIFPQSNQQRSIEEADLQLRTTAARILTMPTVAPKSSHGYTAALLPIKKTAGQITIPTKRASLLLLTSIILLIILVLGTLAYITSIPTPLAKHRFTSAHSIVHASSSHAYSAPDSRSFHVGEHPLLVIKGHNSNVDIRTGSADTVMVTTKMHGSNPTPVGNGTTIQYAQSRDQQGYDHISIAADPGYSDVDYTMTVPSSSHVQIEVDTGSINVYGISGVIIDTGGGTLDIEDMRGSVDAYTESGDITAHAIKGQMNMETVNGSIKVDSTNGQLKAITQNGDVVVREATLNGQSTLQTINGSVRFEGTIDPHGVYKMETNRGDINLTLPGNTAFQLDASTHSGSINNAFGNNVVGTAPRAHLMLHIGNGGSVTVGQAT